MLFIRRLRNDARLWLGGCGATGLARWPALWLAPWLAPWLALLLASAGCTAEGGDDDREFPAHCYDDRRSGDESYRDCGGSCGKCPAGDGCMFPQDCESGVCRGGFCLFASCHDATLNQDETDVDCGGGACEPCEGDRECAAHADCLSLVCDDGRCALTSCDDGVLSGNETDTDCGGSCGDCDDGGACAEGSDCASGLCAGGLCASPTCDDEVQNGDESDTDCGGADCGPCEDGSECTSDDDCASDDCFLERCISCGDGLQNGTETGRDCGSACGPCPPGDGCQLAEDCESGICADNLCAAPTCFDDVANGDETDEDCGGDCAPCAGGLGCVAAEDCASLICDGGTCTTSSCTDRVKNGGESDIDCGGTTACTRCANFRECAIPEDCASNVCNNDDICGTQDCVTQREDSASDYRLCRFKPATSGCPDLSAATSTGLVTYDSYVTLPIGFAFPFFGASYTQATVQTHGSLTFDAAYLTKNNVDVDVMGAPDDIVAVLWDDLDIEFAGASVRYQAAGTAPNRTFAVRWDIGSNAAMTTELATFTVVLYESGDIRACYTDTTFGVPGVDAARSATLALFHGGAIFDGNPFGAAIDDGVEMVWYTP